MSRTSGGGSPRDGGVNGLKAVVLIAVLVLLTIGVLARSGNRSTVATTATTRHATTPTTAPAKTAAPSTTPTTVLPASQVKVQVLNGVLTGALAGQWSAKLKANPGYQTMPPDNATAKVSSTVIYILTPGYQPEADALAAAVGLPSSVVDPTVPPPASAPIPLSERSTANLVLVIGPDLAGGV